MAAKRVRGDIVSDGLVVGCNVIFYLCEDPRGGLVGFCELSSIDIALGEYELVLYDGTTAHIRLFERSSVTSAPSKFEVIPPLIPSRQAENTVKDDGESP